jgi:hypothetical protein
MVQLWQLFVCIPSCYLLPLRLTVIAGSLQLVDTDGTTVLEKIASYQKANKEVGTPCIAALPALNRVQPISNARTECTIIILIIIIVMSNDVHITLFE